MVQRRTTKSQGRLSLDLHAFEPAASDGIIQGMAETKLLAFSDSQKQNRDPEWDTFVVRPGGVLMKQWGWITGIIGNSLFIQVDVLGRAMVATAINGDPEKRVFHAALVEKGQAELSKRK